MARTSDEMLEFQAEEHELIDAKKFASVEEFVLQLIHTAAYDHVARLAQGKMVLDLGCNTGYGTSLLSKYAERVVGVDVSEKAIELAKSRHGSQEIEFKHIDGKTLPFDESSFDLVISFQVIEHIVDYDTYIGEIKRVMAPGGVVVFSTPNSRLRLDPGMKPWNKFHVREFDHGDLQSLLANYYGEVSVLGLFAVEPLYAIEASRLARAREVARRAAAAEEQQWRSLTARAKRMLPKGFKSTLKKMLRPAARRDDAKISEMTDRFTVADLFYSRDDLDRALDLLALCAEGDAVDDCIRKLLKDPA